MSEDARPQRRKLLALLPLAIFVALAGVFLAQLFSGRDASTVPSALIGSKAPDTILPGLDDSGVPPLDSSAFAGKVTLVNVFASWCVPCRDEHPILVRLGQDERLQIAGLNYKDQPENARRFLGELGNPFGMIGVDPRGRAAINWGVYGVPETFVVGKDGTILYKHVGPLTDQAVRTQLMPVLTGALEAP